MTTQLDTAIAALQTDITNLSAAVSAATTAIADLRAQIGQAGEATPEQLAALSSIDSSLQAATTSLATAAQPPTPGA